jgi:hypothetical protein
VADGKFPPCLSPSPISSGWQAQRDDVIPLFAPVVLPGGTRTNRIFVRKGTLVTIEIDIVNRMHALWGEDAWEFRPDRWLKPLPEGAQAIAGYHHLSSFGDGSKVYAIFACLITARSDR